MALDHPHPLRGAMGPSQDGRLGAVTGHGRRMVAQGPAVTSPRKRLLAILTVTHGAMAVVGQALKTRAVTGSAPAHSPAGVDRRHGGICALGSGAAACTASSGWPGWWWPTSSHSALLSDCGKDVL